MSQTKPQDLALRQTQEIATPAPTAPPNIGVMLAACLERGVTKENADAVGKLMELYEHMEDRNAAKEFNRAFVELQREIPKVRAIKSVPNNDGSVRYAFAPFEEIDDQARPVCLAHGFTYTFSEGEARDGRISKVCTLAHVGGHSRSNTYSVRIGKGPPGCTESQVDGAAHTYAKRGALCDALNIRIEKVIEQDPRQVGGVVTPEQAAILEDRVKLCNADVDKFLRYAGADMTAKNRFATIPAGRYAECDAMLKKKEGRA